MSDALGIAMAVLIVVLAYWTRRGIRRLVGGARLGRFVAEVAAGVGFGFGIAAAVALTGHGWHMGRDTLQYPTSWPLTSVFYILLGFAGGVGSFAAEELGGGPWFASTSEEVFPASYVCAVLAAERTASAAECRHMAGRLARRARRSKIQMPPPLLEFVERHRGRTA